MQPEELIFELLKRSNHGIPNEELIYTGKALKKLRNYKFLALFIPCAIVWLSVFYYMYTRNGSDFTTEYEIEVLNENTVQIRTNEGDVFTCPIDEIGEALLIDNI